ncbi:ATP-dependent RNA helicase WM6 [Aduncisulcus paluster]|uniref:ATP-dependent RNA helicase WM6 n=1 Tax=Aduncisulcus paluster TaxID=2918883 RepID=A0ABQ5KV66_9EUKA|nr:ATP-dependent RNA helicase WM6 [Aduncisulcus paluster]|eukprot:gnl/Carplike_NY0171/1816_a2462_887.p1 GENE.gnl/Carplike_NY0171/1816_a2462_887~~gnl/Carplike_NY0171/1816_a2462_887.p1  ORF type:complete len:426 (-),score=139.72 gnl/Carplike_NY0171/1816_a2462_887:56-1333(-)
MADQELLDLVAFDEAPEEIVEEAPVEKTQEVKGSYASLHSTSFNDFLLKDPIRKAITEAGFEQPSEVQNTSIPHALLGQDLIVQGKSGLGKTAVFVLSILNQLVDYDKKSVACIVLAHTRELALQISREFARFSTHLPTIRTMVVTGGVPIKQQTRLLMSGEPQIIVGTPGRTAELVQKKYIDVSSVRHFVVDECDKIVSSSSDIFKKDLDTIFSACPEEKQVMMFTATLPEDALTVCKSYMKDPREVKVDDQSKLRLDGLLQHFKDLKPEGKNRALVTLLDTLPFSQLVIFVSSVPRCKALSRMLADMEYKVETMHSHMSQSERVRRFDAFKAGACRILVATELFARGVDVKAVNIVVNYDMPKDSDTYLHRVGRAGRFGTKGLAISFVCNEEEKKVLKEVQERFVVEIKELPDKIDTSTYMMA